MTDANPTYRLSRRGLLMSSASVALAAGLAACGDEEATPQTPTRPAETEARAGSPPFFGPHQPGIVTPAQRHLQFAAFDLQRDERTDLQDLLRAWSSTAANLMAGRPIAGDTGEAAELSTSGLTVTFAFGPSLFERDGNDRLGLRRSRPPALEPLPAFRGDDLDPRRCGGDLAVQVCADDAQVAFAALHSLTRVAHGVAAPRWSQAGFLSSSGQGKTGRNLLGFKDGTRNLDVGDAQMTREQLWVPSGGWMAGGTYLVFRRVRTLLDVWDATTVEQQERAIGRSKVSGAPLGRRRERDAPDFSSVEGPTAIPPSAHVRVAAPEHNGGARMLRRGFNYADGVDPVTEQLDVGLAFISFQRDPQRQFVAVQRRLADLDALSKHLQTTGSAIFACPPGARPGGYVGEALFT